MIDQQVETYNRTIEKLEREAADREKSVSQAMDTLQKHIAFFKSRGLIGKAWYCLPYLYRKAEMQKIVDGHRSLIAKEPAFKKEALELLVLESARHMMLSGDKHSELKRLEADHATLLNIYKDAADIERAANGAISEVDSAISSLSSAQSMEMLDMMTKNKGISMMSTMQNFSASDAVTQASRAVQTFQLKLAEHQRKWREFEHDIGIELTDFVFDMLFDSDMLDVVGSLFSMMALSSAESDLRKVRAGLSELANKLSLEVSALWNSLKTHEALLLSFKTEQRRLILPMLRERGIEVSDDVFSGITKLYAPSSGV